MDWRARKYYVATFSPEAQDMRIRYLKLIGKGVTIHFNSGVSKQPDEVEECRKYLDRARPSCYSESGYTWDVYKYELDEIDYASLNKELDEKERIKYEAELEKERQEELAELARLKAKYEIYFKG